MGFHYILNPPPLVLLAYIMVYNRWIEQNIKPVQLSTGFTLVFYCKIGYFKAPTLNYVVAKNAD